MTVTLLAKSSPELARADARSSSSSAATRSGRDSSSTRWSRMPTQRRLTMARGCSGGRGGGHRGAGLIEGGTAHEAEGDKRSGQQREPAHDEGDVHAVDESGVDGVAHDVTVDSWRQCGQASSATGGSGQDLRLHTAGDAQPGE